ncbi:MAG TPA: hypothetical protein VF266_06450 [Thermoanaerobaculia bacterium]
MRAAILSLLFALPLLGSVTLDPIAPTDHSFVALQIREAWGSCLPGKERITRDGNAFTVFYEMPTHAPCPTGIIPWNEDVPLGALPAGMYSVTVQVTTYVGMRTLASIPFVVTEAEPALRYRPRIASSAGGTEVTFVGVCSGTAIVDGAPVPSRIENCHLIATLPAHAPGPVNVRIGATEVVNAVQYVDPAAAPDASLYERVLIPVLFNGPGAFGSRWETEVVLQGDPPGVLPDVSAPLRTDASIQTLFGNRASGLVLFLPRGHEWSFSSHVRNATQWGTELPVVREGDTRRRIRLQKVPFDPRYRLQLRIYGIDGVGATMSIVQGMTWRTVTLRGPCSATPCNSDQPAYASVDLKQLFAGSTGTQTIELRHPAHQPLRFWAFVTVTDNETQHVTVISPQ